MASFRDTEHFYPTRPLSFRGRTVTIVLQTENGPCPLLAIANILALKGSIQIDGSHGFVTGSQLRELIAGSLRKQKVATSLGAHHSQFLQNINQSIAMLPAFEAGLDINVGFTSPTEYEFSESMLVFDNLDLKIFHGWLVDPKDPFFGLLNGLRYNTIQDRLAARDAASPEEARALESISHWLREHSSQLTSYGLSQLRATLRTGSFGVFFRNNHFSCLYKHLDQVFLLVTDVAYRDTPVCWEIPGVHDSTFYDQNFDPVVQHSDPVGPAIPSSSLSVLPSPAISSSSLPASPASDKKTLSFFNSLNNATRVLAPPKWPKGLEALKRLISTIFTDLPHNYNITYCDPEGDWISMTTDSEYEEGISIADNLSPPVLKIRVNAPLGSTVLSSQMLPPRPEVTPPVVPTPAPTTSIPPSTPPPAVTPHIPPVSPSPAPAPAAAAPFDPARCVPAWFQNLVWQLTQQGYELNLSIEALIRNAGQYGEALTELQASQVRKGRASRPPIAFSADFAQRIQELYTIFPHFSPYLCAVALISSGGDVPAAALSLSSDLTQFESLVNPSELAFEVPDPAEDLRRQQEAQRLQEEARRLQEAQARAQEEAQRRQQEAQRAQEETRRQQEEARRQQEEARRLQEAQARAQEEARRQQEALRAQEEARRQQEEIRRQQEESKHREDDQRRQLQEEISAVDRNILNCQEQLSSLSVGSTGISQTVGELHRALQSLEDQVKAAEEALARAQNERSQAVARLAHARQEQTTLEEETAKVVQQLQELQGRKAALQENLQRISVPRAAVIIAGDIPSSSSLASFTLPTTLVSNLLELEKRGFSNPEVNLSTLIENSGNLEKTVAALQRKYSSR